MPEENRKENYIKKLANNYSIETTPNVYQKFGSLKEMLPNKNDIYVTYLPDENPKRIIETSKQIVDEEGNYKEQIMSVHKRWADVEYWKAIKRRAPAITGQKYLKGMDMYKNENGEIVSVEKDRRIHRILWLRTLEIAFFVTLFCFLMAYPIAHLLATLPMKYSNLLMI